MKPNCIMGVDPGASGAVAFYFPDYPDRVAAEDVPLAYGMINVPTLADRIQQFEPSVAVIEDVHAMPKQGVSSTFKFGVAFGMAQGIIGALRIPMHRVTPSRWKKHFRLSADKEEARALALRLFPTCADSFSRKKDHGRAEAALIARFFVETTLRADLAA